MDLCRFENINEAAVSLTSGQYKYTGTKAHKISQKHCMKRTQNCQN